MISFLLDLLGIAKVKQVGSFVVSTMMWLTGQQPLTLHATTFGPPETDRFNTGDHACLVATLRPNKEARQMVDRGALIANRTLPCWTEVQLTSLKTGKKQLAVVADRGPYGKNAAGIDVWLGYQDEPGVAVRLGLDGNDDVEVQLTGRVLATEKSKERHNERANNRRITRTTQAID